MDRLRILAQPGSASALGAEGRRFKSYMSDHFRSLNFDGEALPRKQVEVGSNPTMSTKNNVFTFVRDMI